MILEVRRIHRKLGRSSKQAAGINADTLGELLLATEDSIRGFEIELYYLQPMTPYVDVVN